MIGSNTSIDVLRAHSTHHITSNLMYIDMFTCVLVIVNLLQCLYSLPMLHTVHVYQGAFSDGDDDTSVSADLKHLEFKLLHDIAQLQV